MLTPARTADCCSVASEIESHQWFQVGEFCKCREVRRTERPGSTNRVQPFRPLLIEASARCIVRQARGVFRHCVATGWNLTRQMVKITPALQEKKGSVEQSSSCIMATEEHETRHTRGNNAGVVVVVVEGLFCQVEVCDAANSHYTRQFLTSWHTFPHPLFRTQHRSPQTGTCSHKRPPSFSVFVFSARATLRRQPRAALEKRTFLFPWSVSPVQGVGLLRDTPARMFSYEGVVRCLTLPSMSLAWRLLSLSAFSVRRACVGVSAWRAPLRVA